ncbi:MAG TPA: hypothetical protein VFI80_09140 [Burkholderiales bacterium]|nr:hypothetical protein [Burkholderiales bacterium]
MLYKITIEPEYLKAELFNRETMEETRTFLQIVAGSAVKHGRSRVLMSVHSSNPVFTVERSGFLAYFKKLTESPEHKIALLGDSEELGISHQYVELIGRQHGVNVQAFRDEAAAIQWIQAKSVNSGQDGGARLRRVRPPA